MSQGDAVTSSIHTYWYQTNLTAYAVKTLELRKKNHLIFPTLKIIQTRTYKPFFKEKLYFSITSPR